MPPWYATRSESRCATRQTDAEVIVAAAPPGFLAPIRARPAAASEYSRPPIRPIPAEAGHAIASIAAELVLTVTR